jgi:hypothetical protein
VPNIESMNDDSGTGRVSFRYLLPEEAHLVSEAIRTAYGDVLRMQSLHRARIAAGDVAVASDHGRELLDYVLGDLCD